MKPVQPTIWHAFALVLQPMLLTDKCGVHVPTNEGLIIVVHLNIDNSTV